jgi:hypothetical protein
VPLSQRSVLIDCTEQTEISRQIKIDPATLSSDYCISFAADESSARPTAREALGPKVLDAAGRLLQQLRDIKGKGKHGVVLA